MGGLPSWLLRDNNMKVRSDYAPYLNATERYFEKLMAVAKRHQFTNGGPIIAVQIENEFSNFGNTKTNKGDLIYLTFLKNILLKFGIHELIFTCDNARDNGRLPGLLMSANFKSDSEKNIKELRSLQPNKPVYVSEFWSGWFDRWGQKHHTWATDDYAKNFQTILDLNSSVNVYMFHGGTNFWFMNGAYIVTR